MVLFKVSEGAPNGKDHYAASLAFTSNGLQFNGSVEGTKDSEKILYI